MNNNTKTNIIIDIDENSNGKEDVKDVTDSLEKPIELNEFLDFLNLSCHVNDMISSNSEYQQRQDTQQQRQQHHQLQQQQQQIHNNGGQMLNNSSKNNCNNRGARAKNSCTLNNILNNKCAQNCLIDDLRSRNDNACNQPADTLTLKLAATGNCYDRNHNPAHSNPNLKICCCCTKSHSTVDKNLHSKLSNKLNYVLNEGILDSVLPFICPVPLPRNYTNRLQPKQKDKDKMMKSPLTAVTLLSSGDKIDLNHLSIGNNANHHAMRDIIPHHSVRQPLPVQRHVTPSNKINPTIQKEAEIVIHVCDEVKKTSCDFSCPKNLLINKMGYFAKITAGQKLEDMDISVHCDINIFDWLIKWIRSDDDNGYSPPELNLNNVIPILVSANFLEMEPLLMECLRFCHAHLSEVVKVSNNIPCLNDVIITRLAGMFTNMELEIVQDQNNRLAPRLWSKMIQSLFEPEPEPLRGHFYSLAGLFRCSLCNKCLTNTMKAYVTCIKNSVRLNRWGQIINHHVRDTSWDVNYFISDLYKDLRSWRLVYWKLWGHAHYLYCYLCESHFPVYEMGWCRYHPESANFLVGNAEGGSSSSVGRYPCCGQQAFRFETLPNYNGCQYRDHTVVVETDRERSILSIVQLAAENYSLGDTPPWKKHQLISSTEDEYSWNNIVLIPQRPRQGILPNITLNGVHPFNARVLTESSTDSESTDTNEPFPSSFKHIGPKQQLTRNTNSSNSSTTTSSDISEFLVPTIKASKSYKTIRNAKKIIKLEYSGRHWSGELSARSNQDYQRDYEEKVLKQVTSVVKKKTDFESKTHTCSRPLGGTYVRLEQEWKEQIKQRMIVLGATSSCLTFNTTGNVTSTTSIPSRAMKTKSAPATNGAVGILGGSLGSLGSLSGMGSMGGMGG